MTLQNAFKDLATNDTLVLKANESTLLTRASEATLATRASESTLATRATESTLATRASDATANRLIDSIDALATLLQRQAATAPTRTLQYARTVNDQMRVNVDNQPAFSTFNGNTGNAAPAGGGTNPTMWANNSWNMADSRQQLAEQQQSNFIMSRNRWVFS